MKKFILVLAAATLAAVAVSAQPRAIGARLGWGGIEVSYQHSLSEANMVSAELSFPGFHGIGANATYDWLNPFNATIPWSHKGEWNWYMGVGAGLAIGFPEVSKSAGANYGYGDYVEAKVSSNWFRVGVAGRVGVEYNFWFPLQLSLDWRPVLGPSFNWEKAKLSGDGIDETKRSSSAGFYAGGLFGIALGVRYLF